MAPRGPEDDDTCSSVTQRVHLSSIGDGKMSFTVPFILLTVLSVDTNLSHDTVRFSVFCSLLDCFFFSIFLFLSSSSSSRLSSRLLSVLFTFIFDDSVHCINISFMSKRRSVLYPCPDFSFWRVRFACYSSLVRFEIRPHRKALVAKTQHLDSTPFT